MLSLLRIHRRTVAAAFVSVTLASAGRQSLFGVTKHDNVNGRYAAANHVIVKFRTPPSSAELSRLKQDVDADWDRQLSGIRAHLLHSRSKHAAELLAQLASRVELEYVEADYELFPAAMPNDASFQNQWALRNVGQNVNGAAGTSGSDVHAPAAWDIATG